MATFHNQIGGRSRERSAALVVILVVLTAALPVSAQAPPPFEDVPPWHWAAGAVATLAGAGIFIGYPPDDRERAANALHQVYDAFAHSAHPAAQGWAERFLANLPASWPEPLRRSRLVGFRLEGVRITGTAGGLIVSAQATALHRMNGAVRESRAALRVDVRPDAAGQWRADYAILAAAHPDVFR